MNLLAISFYAPPQLTPQAIQVARLLYHLDAGVTLVHGRDAKCADSYDQYPDFFRRVAALFVADPGPRLQGAWRRAGAAGAGTVSRAGPPVRTRHRAPTRKLRPRL